MTHTPLVDCGAAHVCVLHHGSFLAICVEHLSFVSESSLTSLSAFQHTWSNLLFHLLVVLGITEAQFKFYGCALLHICIGFSSVLVEIVANPIFRHLRLSI